MKLAAIAPSHYTDSIQASEEDYASIMKILNVIQAQFPMRGIITGVPMLIALDEASSPKEADSNLMQRVIAMKTIISHVWLTIAQVWKVSSLATLAEKVCCGCHQQTFTELCILGNQISILSAKF
jgi:hypothetical protein